MRHRGFTLVELCLMLAIIGTISAIAIPALLSQRAKAKERDPKVIAALQDIDNVIKKSKPANIVFNAPSSIPFDSDQYIDLRLSVSKSIQELKDQISNTGVKHGTQISASSIMSARLTGTNFAILALTPEEQAVTQVTDTFWKWKITPQKWGDQVLHLTIDMVLDIKGKPTHKAISSYDTKINILITPLGKLKYIWYTYWILICTTIIIPVAGYILKKYFDRVKAIKSSDQKQDVD